MYVLSLQLATGGSSFTRFQHKTGGINHVDLNGSKRTGTCLIFKYTFLIVLINNENKRKKEIKQNDTRFMQ